MEKKKGGGSISLTRSFFLLPLPLAMETEARRASRSPPPPPRREDRSPPPPPRRDDRSPPRYREDRSPPPPRDPRDFRDTNMVCRDCNRDWTWTVEEQQFFHDKGLLNPPGRCPDCRRQRRMGPRGNDRYAPYERPGEREITDVQCSECGKPCTVPFRPTQGRPVFCNDCFASRRGGGGGGPPPSRDRYDDRRDDRRDDYKDDRYRDDRYRDDRRDDKDDRYRDDRYRDDRYREDRRDDRREDHRDDRYH